MSTQCYGLLARFKSAKSLVAGARSVRDAGYERIDAFTPFPVSELFDILNIDGRDVKRCVLIGALLGAAGGYFLQWYTAVYAFAFNIGGRPLNSWPAFIIITFEMFVLGGALAGYFGMLALNKLPCLHHPVFAAPGFHLASRDRFFLLIESSDVRFDIDNTRALLESLAVEDVVEVPS